MPPSITPLRAIFRSEAFSKEVVEGEEADEETDYVALQRDAAANGEVLPPATLRAVLLAQCSDVPLETEQRPPTLRESERCSGMSECSTLVAADISMSQIPTELLLAVLAGMDAPTLATLSCVSRDLCALASSEELWRALVRSRYEPVRWALPPGTLTPIADTSPRPWYELYVSLATPGHEGNWQCLAAAHATTPGGTCWIVLNGCIYDVTEFMHRHPGMAASLELFGGTDASEAFQEVPHSPLAHNYMRTLEVCGPDGDHLRLEPEYRLTSAHHRRPPEGLPMATSWLEMAQGGATRLKAYLASRSMHAPALPLPSFLTSS